MPKVVSVFLLFVFFLWIVPLCVFIKPSDETKTRGGQRAICLCTHAPDKQHKVAAGVLLKSASGTHKEEGTSGGGSHQFLAARFSNHLALTKFRLLHEEFLSLQSAFLKPIDHVPKA